MIKVDYRDPRPIYEQIKDEFKKLIFLKVLKDDEQIPSVREIASQLSINPNTIQRAYKELENEGYIYSIKGKGSFVSQPDNNENAQLKEKLFDDILKATDELLFLGITKDEIIEKIRKE